MKIVILGGVAAGAKAAAKARRLLPDANIELYTDDTKEILKIINFYW